MSTVGDASSRAVIARVNTWLRCVAMLTLVMPARTAATRPASGTPDEPCSTSGTGTELPQCRNEIRVELGRAVGHRVTAAHGDGERVDAGVGDEAGRVVRVGAHAGRVDAVLAADLAELGLDADPGGVAQLDDAPGHGAVLVVGQRRPVEHHRRQAEPDRLLDERDVLGVVEVHDDRLGARVGDGERRGRDRRERAVVAHAVLARSA